MICPVCWRWYLQYLRSRPARARGLKHEALRRKIKFILKAKIVKTLDKK